MIKTKKKHLIQDGEIKYSDLYKPEKPLFSRKYMIAGKPDYIIKDKKNQLIPVEVKTGNHQKPLKYHVMQLAAYCQLVEEKYNCFTPYGILVYYDSKKNFTIPYDPSIRFELESTIKSMRIILKKKNIYDYLLNSDKCFSCSMRVHCDNNIK